MAADSDDPTAARETLGPRSGRRPDHSEADLGPPAEDTRACPACGALHTSAVRFCEECGAPQTRRAAPRTVGPRRARAGGSGSAAVGALGDDDDQGPSLDREGRRLANAALLKARKRLRFVRFVLWLHALSNGLAAVLYFSQGPLVLAWVSVAIVAVAACGALTLSRFPFGWTVGCAAFQTLVVVAIVGYGGIPVFPALFAMLLWSAVPVTARAGRILREHDDLYDADHLKGKRSTSAPKAEVRVRAEAQRSGERRARLRTLAIAAGVVGVLGVGGALAMRSLSQPRERAPRIDAFRAALAAGDAAAGEDLCTGDYRGPSWRKVTTILEREGWLPGGVTIGAPEVLREGERFAEVRFTLPRGDMRTMWRLVERDWCLDGVVFKGVRGE